jgi:hypothetical protein
MIEKLPASMLQRLLPTLLSRSNQSSYMTMRKSAILLAGVMLGLTTTVAAQIGLKGGVNIATLVEASGDAGTRDLSSNSTVVGMAGLTVDLDLTEFFTVQPEILYIQKGGKSSFKLLGTRFEQVSVLNFVEVPVLAKVRFGNHGRDNGVGAYIAAGPWAGIAINGKYKTTTFNNDGVAQATLEEKYTFDKQDHLNRFDWGVSGGIGVLVGRIILEGRYNYGIQNLSTENAPLGGEAPKLHTRGISVTLGVTL